MSVQIEPSVQLSFKRPFTSVVETLLRIKNIDAQPVAFKVKTTAPKQYCVRPNSGLLQPNESAEVQILMQPMKENPSADALCKDKFLVQSVRLSTEEASMSTHDMWANLDSKRKASVLEHKLRVVWLSADNDTNGLSSTTIAASAQNTRTISPMQTSASEVSSITRSIASADTSNRESSLFQTADADLLSPSASFTDANSMRGKVSPFASPSRPISVQSSAIVGSSAMASTGVTSQDNSVEGQLKSSKAKVLDLERRITSYEMQIRQLQSQANELRKRRPEEQDKPSATSDAQVVTRTVYAHDGYSAQIILVVSVVSFLLGVAIF